MPKARVQQAVEEVEIWLPRGGTPKVPTVEDLKETGLLPDVHWRIADERERKERYRTLFRNKLLRSTETWEGFSTWLLGLRETLVDTHARHHLMMAWRTADPEDIDPGYMEPDDWPKIPQDELDRYLGPWPDKKYKRDRAWIQRRFLESSEWDREKTTVGVPTVDHWLKAD